MIHPITSQLSALIIDLPLAAHILEVQTNTYLIANIHHAKHHGFNTPQEAVYITFDALFNMREQKVAQLQGNAVLEAYYKILIELMNEDVCTKKESVQFTANSLSPTGHVSLKKLRKIPLFNQQQQVTAILTYAEDITHSLSLIDLYKLYQKHYQKKLNAIQAFLSHLKVVQHFYRLPTNRELMALLAMHEH